jgi:3-isopropylmalate dehydrogenase
MMKLLVLPGDGIGPAITSAAARTMTAAPDRLLANPATRTADLGGRLGTAAFGDAVVKAVLAG